MRKLVSTLLLGALFCVTNLNLFGQAQDGNVLGAVLDPTGSAIPAATIELENTATGVKSSTKTDTNGFYGSTTSWSAATRHGHRGGLHRHDPEEPDRGVEQGHHRQHHVGSRNVSTAVDVMEAAPLIDTTTAQVSNNYEARMAAELPSAANPSRRRA